MTSSREQVRGRRQVGGFGGGELVEGVGRGVWGDLGEGVGGVGG